MAESGFWNSSVNRLYYSLYYTVNALLVLNGINSHSHSGTKGQFSLSFIKTGRLDLKYGKLFAQLYDWRQKGDYQNLFEYDSESVMPLFEQVNDMLDQIKSEIEKSNRTSS